MTVPQVSKIAQCLPKWDKQLPLVCSCPEHAVKKDYSDAEDHQGLCFADFIKLIPMANVQINTATVWIISNLLGARTRHRFSFKQHQDVFHRQMCGKAVTKSKRQQANTVLAESKKLQIAHRCFTRAKKGKNSSIKAK